MNQAIPTVIRYINEADAATYLGVSVKTLQRWRFKRRGPAYSKVGGKLVRYSLDDLNLFISQARIDPQQ